MRIEKPKISVKVVTYNQERLISRAIESLLSQQEYIYEICVSDDCSTDHTWDVLLEYDRNYPGLFVLNRNEHNLGIFENIEKSWELPTGDIVYNLAGDDECGKGWIKTVFEYIINNKIDYNNELFGIFGDHQCIYPNGDTFTVSNKYSTLPYNRIKLYERGVVYNRGTCYSINILKQFVKVSQGRSYIAENAQDSLMHIFMKKAYYIPKVANIYYTNIGVSKNISSKQQKEHEKTMDYAFNIFKSMGIHLDNYDLALPAHNLARKHFIQHKTLNNYIKILITSWRCFDPKVSLKNKSLKRLIFRIKRRLPHKKPIKW